MANPGVGEIVKGYKILEEFRMAGGGTCLWTFAKKDGRDYFIKVFLSPKLPVGYTPGSEEALEKRRERCRVFEKHQRDLMKRVEKSSGEGGNLIAPVDFFEHNGRYFKISPKVVVSTGIAAAMPSQPISARLTLCLNVCTALGALHNNSIVHGDLKLDNILIEKHGDVFKAKLIDFDSSYVVGSVPKHDEIMGDPPYYSPELLNYIQEKVPADRLTTASDIFALGIVFCEYLTGSRPKWPGKQNYMAEAVRAGESITFPPIPNHDGRGPDLERLLHQMLSMNPEDRPSIMALQIAIKKILSGARGPAPVPGPDDPVPVPVPGPDSGIDVSALKDEIRTLLDKVPTSGDTADDTGSIVRGKGAAKRPASPVVAETLKQVIETLRTIAKR